MRKGAKASQNGRSRWKRALIVAVVAMPVLLGGLWWAIHRFEWMGPLVANSLRAVVGTDTVAKLEDTVYAIEDRFNRWYKKDDKPKAYWRVPAAPPPKPAAPVAPAPGVPALPPFEPVSPGPLHKEWSAPGDGQWVRIVDSRRPDEAPYMFKTLLHPDPTRSWAELFVVAVDLRRVDVIPVAGTQEPKATEKAAESYERTGVIPKAHHEELLAAFNGGFMTEHGGYGMMLDGVTLVSPKPQACTLAMYEDGSFRIATWEKIQDSASKMKWYRQAPTCMYENDKMHPGLRGKALKWGATLDGETVIRRSAVGLNAARDILYVAITNHTTAPALALGMHHVGATDIAQMDVNWSYPKFVLFQPPPGGGERKAVALAEGFEFHEDEYIRKSNRRDFFYLMRKTPSAVEARK